MDYFRLTDRFATITAEIGHIEDQISKGDKDLALIRKLDDLRKEQAEMWRNDTKI